MKFRDFKVGDNVFVRVGHLASPNSSFGGTIVEFHPPVLYTVVGESVGHAGIAVNQCWIHPELIIREEEYI